MNKVNLTTKFNSFGDYWAPKIIGVVNDQHVKIVKLKGEFVWHHHEKEDEMFLVVKGSFIMELRDQNIELHEGEILVVPKGVEHRPVANEEAWVLLCEPSTTLNTGNIINERSKSKLENI